MGLRGALRKGTLGWAAFLLRKEGDRAKLKEDPSPSPLPGWAEPFRIIRATKKLLSGSGSSHGLLQDCQLAPRWRSL